MKTLRIGRDEFQGLSPEQMFRMLHFPFTSPEWVGFAEVLSTAPTAPILSLFDLLVEAMGEQGLKPTAKGNLPRKFCREAALSYWGEETWRENTRIRSINREEDFLDLHVTRLVAELAGLIRKYKGRFILSRDCRSLLNGNGASAIYSRLLKTYIEQFNWGYWDGYPEIRFIQNAFLFTLYLLTLYGDTWRPHTFYEDRFLHAFPMVLQEIPPDTLIAPDEAVRNCYTWRTLIHFAGFFGLAATETQNRAAPINIRARPTQRNLIDKAAAMLNKNRSDFMLEAACREAENVLLDQRLFLVDDRAWQAFETLIDAPVKDNPALRKLLHDKTPWEK